MNLDELLHYATQKTNLMTLENYANFAYEYLSYISKNRQAIIVSQNEHCYIFYQYNEETFFAITRPINSNLMISISDFQRVYHDFLYSLLNIRDLYNETQKRTEINNFIYTCQQTIGASLDALPVGKSNIARKITGDLFERFIRLILQRIGINATEETIHIPIHIENENIIHINYQHDLVVRDNFGTIKAIGSIKTSSKDRLDKIFIDKFLYNKLTNSDMPHFAIFLNDVQRSGKEPKYKINSTFLSGHFKAYTIKLNPLNGVYYCDLRPCMLTDNILAREIKRFDCLLVEDIWQY